MNMLMKSEARLLLQETFKGYGKGLSVLGTIFKAIKLDTDGLYAIVVLVLRGTASSFLKQSLLYILLRKKKFRINKPKANFIFVSVPSILLYSILSLAKSSLSSLIDLDYLLIEKNAVVFFLIFMVISRVIRSLNKIINTHSKREKKKYKRNKKAKKALKK